MNLEKFTERSRGSIQAAQTIAERESHGRLGPEHLLKALLDDPEGLSRNLISRSGGNLVRIMDILEINLSKIAKVTGISQLHPDSTLNKVLLEAEKILPFVQ
jgi:ATP-dependent Clp protease ATP-binding subunit ClpB